MGGSSSKLELPDVPLFDESKASVGFGDVQDYEEQVRSSIEKANLLATQAYGQSTFFRYTTLFAGFCLLIVGIYFSYLYLWPWLMSFTIPSIPGPSNLSVTSAVLMEDGKPDIDVHDKVVKSISNGQVDVSVNDLGATANQKVVVHYIYTGGADQSVEAAYNGRLVIKPTVKSSGGYGPSWSGFPTNHLSTAKDATQVSTVAASSAPLSDGKEGSYGYQFWMYIKDWNYKFGQEKDVVLRTDSTNSAIMNPRITLHPTDNTLKISVSIFPSGSDSSKTEPAPAGHSGATDDVFICEVPDIPLQTWVAVSVTVSSRNLDVYLNGMLVKSCLLTGVPKPAAGDIVLNKDGGFSGWMCSFYSYSKMLQPADTQMFFASGVPCSIPGTTAPTTNAKVTFGLFDTKGKEVSKYVF